ncbi:MAG: lysostaphin resistance A-like protein [Paracoccaceae bacterium]
MTPLAAYIAPGAGRPGLWRVGLSIAIVAVFWIGFTAVCLAAVVLWQIAGGAPTAEALRVLDRLMEARDPASIALMLATFLGIWIGLWVALRYLHRQPFATLYAPEGRIRRLDFAVGLLLGSAVFAISVVLALAVGGMPERSELDIGTWALWFVPIVVLVFFQASGEELIFRGYLLQQLARRYANPLVWALLPSALFGLLHLGGDVTGVAGLLYALATLLFGISAALLVWRTGSLAAAMGLHTAINILGLTVLGLDGVLSGAQLFSLRPEGIEMLLIADCLANAALLLYLVSPACPVGASGSVESGPASDR